MLNRTIVPIRSIWALAAAMGAAAVLTASVDAGARRDVSAAAQNSARPGAPQPLFMQVAGTAPPPTSALAKHTLRRTVVTVSDKALASGAILNAQAHVLNLFPDVEIVAMRSRVESHSATSYSWFGSIPEDEFGSAILTVVNGRLGAAVTYQYSRYMVLPLADGRNEVLEIDPESFPEGPDVAAPDDLLPPQPAGSNDGARTSYQLGVTNLDFNGVFRSIDLRFAKSNGNVDHPFKLFHDNGTVIDVLVFYTGDAAMLTDGSNSPPIHLFHLIQLAIDEANQSFVKSNIGTSLSVPALLNPLRLVNYTETGTVQGDLTKVSHDNEIAALRDLFAADLVVMITASANDPETCGTGQQLGAFSVVKADCLPKIVLAHEIGHNLDAKHDWYTYLTPAPEGDGFPFPADWQVERANHGYFQVVPPAVRTIMAYRLYCIRVGRSCPWVARWSDPNDLTQNGLPLGTPQGLPYPANDAQTLRDHREQVANNRQSACRVVSIC
jgi:hypothetical protein